MKKLLLIGVVLFVSLSCGKDDEPDDGKRCWECEYRTYSGTLMGSDKHCDKTREEMIEYINEYNKQNSNRNRVMSCNVY